MRKMWIVLLCLAACLTLGAATAGAFVWHMSYGQAKNSTKRFAREACRSDAECSGWRVSQCRRRSPSRFSCLAGFFYPGLEPGVKIECDIVLHWGVDRGGYVALKRHGRPRCFAA